MAPAAETIVTRLAEVLFFIEDEQHLVAIDRYRPLKEEVTAMASKSRNKKILTDYHAMHDLNSAVIEKLLKNAGKLLDAKIALTDDEGWTFAQVRPLSLTHAHALHLAPTNTPRTL
jgi:hypothetical protein